LLKEKGAYFFETQSVTVTTFTPTIYLSLRHPFTSRLPRHPFHICLIQRCKTVTFHCLLIFAISSVNIYLTISILTKQCINCRLSYCELITVILITSSIPQVQAFA